MLLFSSVLALLLLGPLEVRAEAEVGADRVESLGVALRLLAEVEARERERRASRPPRAAAAARAVVARE